MMRRLIRGCFHIFIMVMVLRATDILQDSILLHPANILRRAILHNKATRQLGTRHRGVIPHPVDTRHPVTHMVLILAPQLHIIQVYNCLLDFHYITCLVSKL